MSCASFLSPHHIKGRRNLLIFGLLLRCDPLHSFTIYFPLISRNAVWIILPALQVVSPSSSPIMESLRSLPINQKLLQKIISIAPKIAIYTGDMCCQRSLWDVKKWQEMFAGQSGHDVIVVTSQTYIPKEGILQSTEWTTLLPWSIYKDCAQL